MIPSLPLRVPGFDAVLGGGLPEYSFNLIAGGAGTGKTTLGLQIAFGNARAERPAIFFTVLGEPTLKILRYQRQFSFFDPALVGSAVEFINLSDEAMQSDPGKILKANRSGGRAGGARNCGRGLVSIDRALQGIGGRRRHGARPLRAVAGYAIDNVGGDLVSDR